MSASEIRLGGLDANLDLFHIECCTDGSSDSIVLDHAISNHFIQDLEGFLHSDWAFVKTEDNALKVAEQTEFNSSKFRRAASLRSRSLAVLGATQSDRYLRSKLIAF